MISDVLEKFGEFFDSDNWKASNKSLILDFPKIIEFDHELADYILDNPIEATKLAEEALNSKGKELFVRFKNLPEIQKIDIRNLRSKDLKKLIYFDGTIRLSSDVRPKLSSATFNCECGNKITQFQTDEKFKKPLCSCGNKYLELVEKHFIDVQRIVVEESAEDLEGGQPKRINVILENDLVEPKEMKKVIPGTKIRVVGYIKEIEKKSQLGGASNIYDIQCQANYIEPLQEDFSDIKITEENIKDIIEFSKREDLFSVLTNSIAPTILGLEKIKQALLFQLFGGVRKILKDNTIFRGTTHILLVGEPGVAKSKIATYISKAAPKARYLAGRSVSGVGISACVVKDSLTGNWVVEAGALVLANNGTVVLDEMDKMTEEDTSALHEALEQGHISISKANVSATLKCNTALLACANPKFGRFDVYKSVAEQIDMPPPLINRFDLIFILKDIPDEDKDKNIAKHILTFGESKIDTVTQQFMRKYIAYARQKIYPEMTKEAEETILKYYVTLRNSKQNIEGAPIPISPRQLEALIRLAESSAKCRLSNKVTKQYLDIYQKMLEK